MDTTNKHDWGLVIAGVLLVICSMFFLFAPGLALVTITVIAGAAFLVSGIFDIVNYFRFRRAMDLSGWALAYGALDIVLGILFLVNPLVSAGALAWFIGAETHRRLQHERCRKLGEIELEQLVHRTGFEEQVGVEAGQRSSHGGLVLEQADGAR